MKSALIDRRSVMFGLAAATSAAACTNVDGGASNASFGAGAPEDVGLSSSGLARIDAVMADYLARNQIQGGVTAVSRDNRLVHIKTHGYFDIAAQAPMPESALFRMASSTKPVTAVALLQQIELGRVSLDDPIGRFIPELANMQAVKPGAYRPPPMNFGGNPAPTYAADELEPQATPITIRHLASHTSGLNWITPIEPGDTLETYLSRLSAVPLDFQPGSRWAYSPLLGPDLLARVVEITSGMRYDRYLKEHIFDPVGMVDTAHNLTPEQRARVVHRVTRVDDAWVAAPSMRGSVFGDEDTTYFDGSAGLKGTARDFIRLYTMLANHGVIDGNRVLSPESVELMRSEQAGGLYQGGLPNRTVSGLGFGILVQVVRDPAAAETPLSAGSFGWGGAFGTNHFADPSQRLAGTIMVQQPAANLSDEFNSAVMAGFAS